jgi:outer membrane protein
MTCWSAVLLALLSLPICTGWFCLTADGAEPPSQGRFLSYKTAVEIALEQHPLIRKSKEGSLAAVAVTEQAKSKYYPQIDAYALQTGGFIRPLSYFNIGGAQNRPNSWGNNVGVLVDQLLYDFGKTAHTVLAERANQDAAEKDQLMHRALVILSVQQAYINVLRQQEILKIAEETVRERRILRDRIAVLYKHQLKSKLDLDLMAMELTKAEVLLVQSRNSVQMAFAGLNNAMGVRGPSQYLLEELSTGAPPRQTLDSLIQEGISYRPELLGSTDRVRAADEKLNAAHALNYPTISALGMTGFTYWSSPAFSQDSGLYVGKLDGWYGLAGSISVPIFTGYLIENRVAEARAQKHKAEQTKRDLGNKVKLEVTDAYLTLQTAEQEIRVATQEVTAARESLDLAKERYRLGLGSIVELSMATGALVTAEVHLADAHYAAKAGGVALSYAVGGEYRRY